jgi:hypothetical protein
MLDVNKYSETNFRSMHEISHRETWRNFAAKYALAKCIDHGKDLWRGRDAQNPHPEGESLMRTRQHSLLAGIAALALFAAGGIALAQQGQQNQPSAGGAAQSAQTQRSGQGAKNQAASQGVKNQGAQRTQNQNAMSRQSSGAEQNARNQSGMQSRQSNAVKSERNFNRSAQQQNSGATNNRTAQGQQNRSNAQNRTQRGTSTAQRNEQLRGLQSSTRAPMQGANGQGRGTANVSLNDQQRTQIRDTIINARNAPRASNVPFNVSVGTVVPRRNLHLVRVPQTLVRIDPAWRGFLYFVYNDQLVIVNPRTMRIVDVLPV